MSTTTYRTMRAVVAESHGTPLPKHLKLTTFPVPTLPSPSHLLIRVLASALNPIDKVIVNGEMEGLIPLPLPHPVGFDAAGIVEEVGSSVTRFKPGDAVFTRVDHDRMGTVAEYCVASDSAVALKPPSLSFDEAASLPLVALTALQALRNVGHLTPGQSVLITGGTGGVGTAAIQLARILGASAIVATQSSDFDRLPPARRHQGHRLHRRQVAGHRQGHGPGARHHGGGQRVLLHSEEGWGVRVAHRGGGRRSR